MTSPAGPGRDGAPWWRRRAGIAVAGLAAAALVSAGVWTVAGRGGDDQATSSRSAPLRLGLPVNSAELDQRGLARALDLARQARVTELSTGVAWWYVSRGQPAGSYDWRALDRLVDLARAGGLRVRLQLSGTPDAVHPDLARTVPEPDDRVWYPPRTPAQLRAWSRFVRATVEHFAGRVDSFEIWNEPNISTFWKPAPSPAEYARLLAAAYRSARQASPSAQVVFGGLSHNDIGYLQRYYAEARRLFPDATQHHNFFDLLSVHPYTYGRSPDETSPDTVVQGAFGATDRSFAGLRLTKAVMDRNERGGAGADKRILIGEYGFSTGRSANGPPVPDRRRAYYLKRAVADAAEMPFVTGLYWYGFLPNSATPRGWAIAEQHGPASWTWIALQDLATGHAPEVQLPDPAAVRPGGPPIRPVLKGLNRQDVLHAELYVDGVLAAQAAGPELRWTSKAPDSNEVQAQLVVYTRDHHAWPSNMVTLRPGTD